MRGRYAKWAKAGETPEYAIKRALVMEKFGLHLQQYRHLTPRVLDQLDDCADDSARRLILGVSEKFTEPLPDEPIASQSREAGQ